MQDWWDEKLRSEEKELREKQRLLGDEDKRIVIGNTQQERLLEAAKREISLKEFIPKWPKRICKKQIKYFQDMPFPSERNSASQHTVGYINMTHVKFKCDGSEIITPVKDKAPKPIKHPKPYLPIILHWNKMDKTTGYPQLKVSYAGMFKCGYYTG